MKAQFLKAIKAIKATLNFCGVRLMKPWGETCACGAPATTVPNGFFSWQRGCFASESKNFGHSAASVHFYLPSPALSRCLSLMLVPLLEITSYK